MRSVINKVLGQLESRICHHAINFITVVTRNSLQLYSSNSDTSIHSIELCILVSLFSVDSCGYFVLLKVDVVNSKSARENYTVSRTGFLQYNLIMVIM